MAPEGGLKKQRFSSGKWDEILNTLSELITEIDQFHVSNLGNGLPVDSDLVAVFQDIQQGIHWLHTSSHGRSWGRIHYPTVCSNILNNFSWFASITIITKIIHYYLWNPYPVPKTSLHFLSYVSFTKFPKASTLIIPILHMKQLSKLYNGAKLESGHTKKACVKCWSPRAMLHYGSMTHICTKMETLWLNV